MQEHLHDEATVKNEENGKESAKDNISSLASHLADYAQTFYRLQLLRITRKGTNLTSSIVGAVAGAIIGLFVILFASIGLAFWLGALVNSVALGFVLVAGFYLLIGLLFMSIRKKMIFPIWRDRIIRKFYE